jgi:ribosomal protein S18 acetylase RimI-like enzyme
VSLIVRRASPADAPGVAEVFASVAAERIYSAIDVPFTEKQERDYLAGLSVREAVFIAQSEDRIVGVQSLDLWSPFIQSMRHVGQIGTFVLREYRGKSIGKLLWAETKSFARAAGYRKLVIQVRASNTVAHRFYSGFGFTECGRLHRQVVIDGIEDDEVLFELFL